MVVPDTGLPTPRLYDRDPVPSSSWYDPVLDAYLHTGSHALDLAEKFHRLPGNVPVSIDLETPGLDRAFEINCLTAAWEFEGRIHTILLDVARNELHHNAAASLCFHASRLILHNAAFDTPALWQSAILDHNPVNGINKIVDTLLLVRFAEPDTMVRKGLEACVKRHLGMDDFAGGMALAFKAAGYRTIADGYEGMDIGAPIYRVGAMADTVQTLRLEPLLRRKAIDWTTDHPFADHGARTVHEAADILGVQETVHRVMLRRTAVGLAVDTEYLTRYAEQIDQQRNLHIVELAVHGLEGGMGKGAALIKYLDDRGELPASWPRTRTGKLSATKADLESLNHPAAIAQRSLAETDKIMGYLEKVYRQAAVTGRCHPQVGVLGASATGRMSVSSPELQQFPADARPILVADDPHTMWSIDWSQIEPVTMALMAKDEGFIAPFEAGEDLYEPIQRSAGIDRKTSKLVLLATMYGQGVRALAARIGHTEESAAQIRRQMIAAMPKCGKWMSQVQQIADIHGRIITAGGRILPVDPGFGYKATNFVVQGSAYDILAHSICELERQGLGDSILIPMHDELVVQGNEELAKEVEHIMLTPPPFLTKWAGRTPILRTDCQPTGKAWASV